MNKQEILELIRDTIGLIIIIIIMIVWLILG